MVLLLSLLITSILIFSGKKWIRAHASSCYILCTAISCLTAAAVLSGKAAGLTGFPSVLASVLTKGGLSGAFFIYVMYAGAVPSGSILQKTIMPVRGELSIMGSILAIGHMITYGCRYFLMLFTQAAAMRKIVLLATVCSLLMILIMVPLFITSIKKIRRKMKGTLWKKIQRPAYAFYALLYLHILFFNIPSALKLNLNAAVNVVLYSIIFLSYAAMRLAKALRKKNKKSLIIPVYAVSSAVFICLTITTGSSFFAESPAAGIVSVRGMDAASDVPSAISDAGYTDGKYTGAAIGYNGRLTVSVTIENGRITDAHLKGSVDDEPYITDAADGVLPSFLSGSPGIVDTVSGATTSAHAIAEAVQDALTKASAVNTGTDS